MSTVQDLSENNTPMLTPVLTPRSSLSRSMLSFSFRSANSARPLSPLVTGTSTPQEERRESPGKKLRSEYDSSAYYNNRDQYCNFVFYLISVSKIGRAEHSMNKSLSLELENPSAYITEDALGKMYLKVLVLLIFFCSGSLNFKYVRRHIVFIRALSK